MPVRKLPPTREQVLNMGLGSAQKIVADHPLYLNMLPEEDFKKAMDAIMNCLILAFMDGWIARGNLK